MGLVDVAKKLDFKDFYEQWVTMQHVTMDELQRALQDNVIQGKDLEETVEKARVLYVSYYDAMDKAAKEDVLQVISPSWRSSLERAFMWLGDWRPSSAYQLVYGLAGQKVEQEIAQLLSGVEAPSLDSLTASQLASINSQQLETLEEEERLRCQIAALQGRLADRPMVSLAEIIKDATGGIECYTVDKPRTVLSGEDRASGLNDDRRNERISTAEGLIKMEMYERLQRLQELLLAAVSLRRRTLDGLLHTLTSLQSAQFLLASFQLQSALRHSAERLKQ
ncbi:hypothetical protein KP509_07G080800 [Ceratopteris richardii]|uniref:DOG1 domain-containing protein n=1 Tax=Ceratopteris richardii TaxID=49495 RepID=A0A8T2UG96_CERRI|nr:hypothetical protein KP509_07G080800 [Ceratopteris richardii]